MNMSTARLDTMRAMVERQPDNALARFGLANEYAKLGQHREASEHYAAYLERYDDEGSGFLRFAESLRQLGRTEESMAALDRGVRAATRFGHQALVADLDALRDDLLDA